jgi:hypothetical protein
MLQHLVDRERNLVAGHTDRDHLEAAASWLARAQDVAGDGGVSGRYLLRHGWTSSYPETTGYLIPTFLALESVAGLSGFESRASRAVEFLLGLQLTDGAFPGGEIAENRTRPSVFNTAQIIAGLEAWHRATGDERARQAARRAADWMLGVQDPDGAWRRHTYHDLAATYHAHAACWLARLGSYLGEERYLAGARCHLEWVLGHVDPGTGWIDLCGFSEQQHGDRVASTHTIAYTLWGALTTAELVASDRGVEVVERAALAIARKLELLGRVDGMLDHEWRARGGYACLTGNAQLALLWFRLFERSRDFRFVNAALKALDLVKRAQPMDGFPVDIRGGVPGSDPIWGRYIWLGVPNWAAKFYLDALLEKARIMGGLAVGDGPRPWAPPPEVPRGVVPGSGPPAGSLRVILYAGRRSAKVEQMVREWAGWGFRPAAVVVERGRSHGRIRRFGDAARERGLSWIAKGVRRRLRRVAAPVGGAGGEVIAGPGPAAPPDPIAFCQREGLPVVEVDSLDAAQGIEAVRELRPDLAIHAGAGILRDPILRIPRLGTLNAHMGLLPRYRGVNVAEWAALAGDAVGCTVHFIDPGIDTGPIAAVREVEIAGATSVAELRDLVDRAQITLLGEVVHFVLSTGHRPPTRTQEREEGRQYFRMHPEVRARLEAALAAGDETRPLAAAGLSPRW